MAQGIVKITYSHEAMIDLIIQEPTVTPKELAELFGFSSAWVSRVVGSDSFQSRLAERKATLLDPHLSNTLNERLRTVSIKAVDIISEKLSNPEQSADFALEALGLAAKGLGLHNTRR